jgi:hypothetical protein
VLIKAVGTVEAILTSVENLQELLTEHGPAICYPAMAGRIAVGDKVLLNRTATMLNLGTGGFDFVMAVMNQSSPIEQLTDGHIVKLRYTPVQIAVNCLESDPANNHIWDMGLGQTPIVVCQLHSQIAHCAAAVAAQGKRAVYVMTDAACLLASFSNLVRQLQQCDLVASTITIGQASGGDYECVSIHSALLAARYILLADVVIVCQGPGNAGTGTKYGFGGIEQASILDSVAALGGLPIACVRMSSGDTRSRHFGVSHHTITTMKLVRTNCTIPVPAGMIGSAFEARHRVVEVTPQQRTYDLIDHHKIKVSTMGRNPAQDKAFFAAAASAGTFAANPEATN